MVHFIVAMANLWSNIQVNFSFEIQAGYNVT